MEVLSDVVWLSVRKGYHSSSVLCWDCYELWVALALWSPTLRKEINRDNVHSIGIPMVDIH